MAVFEEEADRVRRDRGNRFHELEAELNKVENEHQTWRSQRGLANEETPVGA
jgi:hypothetical protein